MGYFAECDRPPAVARRGTPGQTAALPSIALRRQRRPWLAEFIRGANLVGANKIPLAGLNRSQMALAVKPKFDPGLVKVHGARDQSGERDIRRGIG